MSLLNWDNPPQLDAPRRRQTQQSFADRLRLAHAKQKRAKGPKNHSTNKERSHIERQKAAMRAVHASKRDAVFKEYKLAIASWWRGERDDFPTHPNA